MAEEVIKIAALGRPFHLGDLYNYRSDCIAAGNYLLRFHFALILVALKNSYSAFNYL
jgi:hypothetical protein